MHVVVETPSYLSDAKQAGMDEADRARVVDHLSRNPSAGTLIEGTGGARKLRFARRGEGKSGGFRVLAAWLNNEMPVFLLAVFAKNERANLSKADINALRSVLDAMKLRSREMRLRR